MTESTKAGYRDCFDLFDGDQQELLLQTPAIVFFLVAAADGVIDESEKGMGASLLDNVSGDPGDLFPAIALRFRRRETRALTTHDPVLLLSQLTLAVRAVSRRLAPEKSKAFVEDLIQFGQMVAEASGGVLFGLLGSKMGPNEKKMLGVLKATLEAGLISVEPKETADVSQPLTNQRSGTPCTIDKGEFAAVQGMLQIRIHGASWLRDNKLIVYEERLPGVVVALVVAREPEYVAEGMVQQAVEYVTEGEFEAWKRPMAEVMKTAIDNSYVSNLTAQVMSNSEMPSLRILAGSRVCGRQLFLLERHPDLLGAQGAVVAVPGREFLLSLPIETAGFLTQLPVFYRLATDIYTDMVKSENVAGLHAICPNIFIYRKGEFAEIEFDREKCRPVFTPKLTSLVAEINEELSPSKQPPLLH